MENWSQGETTEMVARLYARIHVSTAASRAIGKQANMVTPCKQSCTQRRGDIALTREVASRSLTSRKPRTCSKTSLGRSESDVPLPSVAGKRISLVGQPPPGSAPRVQDMTGGVAISRMGWAAAAIEAIATGGDAGAGLSSRVSLPEGLGERVRSWVRVTSCKSACMDSMALLR